MTADDGRSAERLVTASEIAEIAGVGQSAVSNWRRRFDDFPQPAGTAPSGGDLFRRDEVERWLSARNRDRPRKDEHGAAQQLSAVADRLRGRSLSADIGTMIAIAAAFVVVARDVGHFDDELRGDPREVVETLRAGIADIEGVRPELAGVFRPLVDVDPADLRLLLGTLAEVRTQAQLLRAVDTVVSRAARYGDFRTPPQTAALLVELGKPYAAVLDPACGSGELLLQAAAAGRESILYGQELSENAWRLAKARLVLHGVSGEVVLGDSFTEDAFPGLRVDLILLEPPAGARLSAVKAMTGDRRWQLFSTVQPPPARASDFAWIAHAVEHVSPDGRAIVLLPTGSLSHGGVEAKLRSELLRQGAIEAIITLPRGALQESKATAAIWIVRQPTRSPDDVLLIAGDDQAKSLTEDLCERIVATVRTWRNDRSAFNAIPGFANTVPVLELLGGDADLIPNRWVLEPSLLDPAELLESVKHAHAALDAARSRSTPQLPDFDVFTTAEPRPKLRVRDLLDQGLATLIRPRRFEIDESLTQGTPVWFPADIRPASTREAPDRDEERRYVLLDPVNPHFTTNPGDIVFTTVGSLRTRVDTDGGHALGTSLQALRLGPALDPEAVAALLMSESNRRLLRGGTIPRVNVQELEIPWLPLAEAAEFTRVLEALQLQAVRAQELVNHAARLRAVLIDVLATGAVTIEIDPRERRD